MQSTTRSSDTAIPTWADNWRLIRNLWPEWSPTDQQVRDIWFRSYNQPHAVKGAGTINQSALRDAILHVNRSQKWKEPKFLDIADAYRREKNRTIADLHRMSMQPEQERDLIRNEHERRLDNIATWTTDRLRDAQALVGSRVSTMRDKSSDPSAWSQVYTGMLVAADEELRHAKDQPGQGEAG